MPAGGTEFRQYGITSIVDNLSLVLTYRIASRLNSEL
jgi:hypothetical protein